MDFARNQMRKHGWTEGNGLGRTGSGMKEAIKVKMKFDSAGVGHNPGDEFTYHWWDHMFNKALDNIQVENNKDGVIVKKGKEFSLSSKKPFSKSMANKTLLYGRFVKASTLTQATESGLMKEVRNSQSSDSDSDDDTPGVAFSHLTDEDLIRICGGRTAHKAARHGLKLNGKLKRLEEQEAGMSRNNSDNNSSEENTVQRKKKKSKKNKKEREESQTESREANCKEDENHNNVEGSVETVETEQERKSKKKKRKLENDKSDSESTNVDVTEVSQCKPKKKKKSKMDISSRYVNGTTENEMVAPDIVECKTKKKHKAKKGKDDNVEIHISAGQEIKCENEETKSAKKQKKSKKEKNNVVDAKETIEKICKNIEDVTTDAHVRRKSKKNKKQNR